MSSTLRSGAPSVASWLRSRWAVALFAIGAGGAALAGCDPADALRDSPPGSSAAARAPGGGGGGRAVDAALLAFLSKARAAHHSADLAESGGDLELAVRHIEVIPRGPLPPLGAEVVEVLADAHARLADLKSELGRFDDAAAEVDKGLMVATDTTHFRGHLFESRGVVEERRMNALEKQGDTAGAARARKAALDAFETSMSIQDAVIRNALPDVEPRSTPPASTAAPTSTASPTSTAPPTPQPPKTPDPIDAPLDP